jgi:hypothetical protein
MAAGMPPVGEHILPNTRGGVPEDCRAQFLAMGRRQFGGCMRLG